MCGQASGRRGRRQAASGAVIGWERALRAAGAKSAGAGQGCENLTLGGASMPFSFLAMKNSGNTASARRFNASAGDLSGCAQDYEEAVKVVHDKETHYLEPWVEQPPSKPIRKMEVTRPMAIPKMALSSLKRCQASAGDLSGAAEDVQEVLGSWSDVPEDHSPTTVLGDVAKPRKKGPSVRKANVWESVFNPGRNYNMEGRVGASQFDKPDSPGGRSTTVWDEILKAQTVRDLAFSDLDKDRDGFITADELHRVLGKDAAVDALILEADKNGDGKIDYKEFSDLLRHS